MSYLTEPAPPEPYTLSLHDALPICRWSLLAGKALGALLPLITVMIPAAIIGGIVLYLNRPADPEAPIGEIGRDTSELQSQSNIVCRLLLEKKKKTSHI